MLRFIDSHRESILEIVKSTIFFYVKSQGNNLAMFMLDNQ